MDEKSYNYGKLQFYLTALDETKKLYDENPSIGIIICKSKNHTIVEYALKSANKPIGVATYSMYDKLPDDMKDLLPTPEEIVERLRVLDNDRETRGEIPQKSI